jgi:hypothetical protein
VERFGRLADLADQAVLPADARVQADQYFELDNLFPAIDYRVFADRER